jgi:hypothetical protein
MTVSLGVAAKARRSEQNRQAEALGEPTPKASFPVEKLTVAVVSGLVVSAVVYHTAIAPKIGVW